MDLPALKAAVPGLADKPHPDKIKIFGWWLHTHRGKTTFTAADVGKCYSDADFIAPSSFGGYFQNLVSQQHIIKSGTGYRLEHKTREKLDAAYGQSAVTAKVKGLLTDLVEKLPDLAERAYYKEALICYTYGSPRAAVIMTWNIAFSHLCDHVIAKRLTDFNAQWQTTFPGMHKSKSKTIVSMDDFNDKLKEADVLTICRDAGIITKNIYNIMHAALGKRNAAAHPSTVVIGQTQADAHIEDLIVNVVLQIK